jgi:hypothetical protein
MDEMQSSNPLIEFTLSDTLTTKEVRLIRQRLED